MRHHFVPQFLLRQWSDCSLDRKLQEFRLDLRDISTSTKAPKGTAFQNDLYALTMPSVAGMSKQAVETRVLRHIDNDAAVVRAKMVQQGLKSLSHHERCNWVRFLMSLKVRQPDVLSRLRIQSSDHLSQILTTQPEQYEALATADDPPTMHQFVESSMPGLIENFGLCIFDAFVDRPEIGQKILGLVWWLCDFTKTKHQLLLADNPCIFTGVIDAPELIIALPISPTAAFLATRGERIAGLLRQLSPSRLVVRINESSVLQARARVYASSRTPERFIRNRLALRLSKGAMNASAPPAGGRGR